MLDDRNEQDADSRGNMQSGERNDRAFSGRLEVRYSLWSDALTAVGYFTCWGCYPAVHTPSTVVAFVPPRVHAEQSVRCEAL